MFAGAWSLSINLILPRQKIKCFYKQIEWLGKAFQQEFSCVIKNCSRAKRSKSSQPIQQPYRLLNQRSGVVEQIQLKSRVCVFKDSCVAIKFRANFCEMQNTKVAEVAEVGDCLLCQSQLHHSAM